MANLKCVGSIEAKKIEIKDNYSISSNIGSGFCIIDPSKAAIGLGTKNGVNATPYIDFFTKGNESNYDARILAENNKLKITASEGMLLNGKDISKLIKMYSRFDRLPDHISLFGGSIGTGTIILQDKLTNYDIIAIKYTADNESYISWEIIPIWQIIEAINLEDQDKGFQIIRSNLNWSVKIGSLNTTSLEVETENCKILYIAGVNL